MMRGKHINNEMREEFDAGGSTDGWRWHEDMTMTELQLEATKTSNLRLLKVHIELRKYLN